MAVSLAILFYSALARSFFSPHATAVPSRDSPVFFSTDVDTTLRPSLERAILDAKQSILLIIYSLSDHVIINALNSVSQRGVSVTVIHDPIETPDARFLLSKEVACHPRRGRGLMHNKLLVIDHAVVWIGSANMSTRSLTEQGNLVAALTCPPLAEAVERAGAAMIKNTPLEAPPTVLDCAGSRWTVFFHPYHGPKSLQELLARINTASRRIFVAMFTCTHPDLISALCRAKERGVDVRIILDQESAQRTSRAAFIRFKRNGVSCGYRTKNSLLHYKAALIDDLLVAGSCNWTRAGFQFNHETLALIDPVPEGQRAWIEQWWEAVERFSTLPK